MASENGWEPLHPSADQLEWVVVPGANVHLQFLKGWPSAILRAFAADWNAYLEPLRDADSAGYTATNSVATSNHLNGTAMDCNWNSHPFRILNAGFNPAMLATMREMLAFYTLKGVQVVWWGNDWNSPKDAMHANLGYNTYNNPVTGEFVARFIRADGYSTFRRGSDPAPPPPPIPAPAQLTRAEGYALRILNEGRKRGVTPKGIQIAFATGIVESNITVYANQKLPKSLALPHDAVGNDGYSVGIFQQQVRDTGNGWWWGDEKTCMGVESSAGLFYDRLVKLPYNGDSKTPGAFAQQIQGSAFPARYDQHWGEAVALYNKLAGISPPTQGDDDLSAEAEQMIREMYADYKAKKKQPSRSFFAKDQQWGESDLGFLLNVDGNVNELYMTWGYLLGVSSIEADVEYIAANGVAPASWAGALGDGWLAEVGQQWCQGLVALRAAMQKAFKASGSQTIVQDQPSVQTVYVDRPAPAAPTDTADHIAAQYRSAQALLNSDVDKDAANQLVAVLKTKTEGAS
jgi:hypothetical protein